MPFALLGHAERRNRQIAISAELFESARRSMGGLLDCLAIEQKFDILAENYDELEGELDSITRRDALFGRRWGSYSMADMQSVNRRMVNFMSTARLYLDQVDHNLSTMFGAGSDQRRAFNTARSREYDTVFGFEVFEALRNYSQHRDIPVHSLTYGREWRDEGGTRQVLHTLAVTLDVSRLEREGGFKASTLEKLKALPEQPQLKRLLREYVSGLRRIHAVVRQQVASAEEGWRQALNRLQQVFREGVGIPDARLLDALQTDDDDNFVDSQMIFDEFLEYLEELRLKNGGELELTSLLRSSE